MTSLSGATDNPGHAPLLFFVLAMVALLVRAFAQGFDSQTAAPETQGRAAVGGCPGRHRSHGDRGARCSSPSDGMSVRAIRGRFLQQTLGRADTYWTQSSHNLLGYFHPAVKF